MFKFFIAGTETFSTFVIVTAHIWTKLFPSTQIRKTVNTVHPVNNRKSVQNVTKKKIKTNNFQCMNWEQQSMFYKSTFYKSMFFKSVFYKSMFYKSSPCFTNPVHILQYTIFLGSKACSCQKRWFAFQCRNNSQSRKKVKKSLASDRSRRGLFQS